jgi:hypothetical protein
MSQEQGAFGQPISVRSAATAAELAPGPWPLSDVLAAARAAGLSAP